MLQRPSLDFITRILLLEALDLRLLFLLPCYSQSHFFLPLRGPDLALGLVNFLPELVLLGTPWSEPNALAGPFPGKQISIDRSSHRHQPYSGGLMERTILTRTEFFGQLLVLSVL